MTQRFEAWMAEGLTGWVVTIVMVGPTHGFGASYPVTPPDPFGVPTEAVRTAALTALGYVAEDGAAWSTRMLGPHRVWSIPIRPLGSVRTEVPEGQMSFGEGER